MLYCRLYSFNIYFILYLSIFPFHHINIVVSIIDIIIIIERSVCKLYKVQHFFEVHFFLQDNRRLSYGYEQKILKQRENII